MLWEILAVIVFMGLGIMGLGYRKFVIGSILLVIGSIMLLDLLWPLIVLAGLLLAGYLVVQLIKSRRGRNGHVTTYQERHRNYWE